MYQNITKFEIGTKEIITIIHYYITITQIMNYKRNNNFVAGDRDRTDRSDRTNGPDRQDRFQGPKISLDDIVNYIENNKKFINTPQTEKLDMNEIHAEQGIEALQYNKTTNVDSLPANLQSIFSSTEFIRAGALTHVGVPADVDVSYISSLIMLMVPDFTQLKDAEKVDFVQAFIRKIHKESRDNFTKFGYDKLGWDVKEFVNNVKIFKMGKDLLRYVADFLGINIFILDYEMDSLIYVGEKTFSKYKKNVLLLKVRENRFEPVFMRDALFINHKSFIIKKLMNSRFLVERLDCDFTNEKEEFNFVIGEEDLEKYFEHLVDKTKKPVDDAQHDAQHDGKNLVGENAKQVEAKDNKTSTTGSKSKIDVKTVSKEKSKGKDGSDHGSDHGSDDLNGFDQEDADDMDQDNPDSGHLSDDDDDAAASYDSDSNRCESEQSEDKTARKKSEPVKNAKTKKIVALSDKQDSDAPEEEESVDSKPKKGAKKPVTKKLAVDKQVKKSTKPEKTMTQKNKKNQVDETKTVAQLKEIAKDLGIELTYVKNGKKTPKTKPMLIEEINNN